MKLSFLFQKEMSFVVLYSWVAVVGSALLCLLSTSIRFFSFNLCEQ